MRDEIYDDVYGAYTRLLKAWRLLHNHKGENWRIARECERLVAPIESLGYWLDKEKSNDR